MKHTSRVVIALLCVVGLAGPVCAQSYTISNTTLSGAISASQTTLVLASASASSGSSFGAPVAGNCLFVDGELMRIVSMNGTTATVARSQTSPDAGSFAMPGTPHASGAVVFTAPCNAFKSSEPQISAINAALPGNANVSCATQPAPWINVNTANVWWCNRANQQWSGTNYAKFTYNSVPVAQ